VRAKISPELIAMSCGAKQADAKPGKRVWVKPVVEVLATASDAQAGGFVPIQDGLTFLSS